MTFARELLGRWLAPDPKFLAAVEMWRVYDRTTDGFDLAHGARINERGEVGPAHPGHRGSSARFAREAFRRLRDFARAADIDDETLDAAKHSRERWRP